MRVTVVCHTMSCNCAGSDAPAKITIHDDARVQASACHVCTGPRTWLNHFFKCLTSCPHVAPWRIDLADNWDSRPTLCFLYQVLRRAHSVDQTWQLVVPAPDAAPSHSLDSRTAAGTVAGCARAREGGPHVWAADTRATHMCLTVCLASTRPTSSQCDGAATLRTAAAQRAALLRSALFVN